MNKRKDIIIDCDPGQDDAVMLLLAFGAPEDLNILGITTVAGNVSLLKTSRNARIISEIGGRQDIKIFAGCGKPLIQNLVTAEHVHGTEGIDGAPIYEPKLQLQKEHAVDFIISTLAMAPDNSITLVPTGPLTNIALALSKKPKIIDKIKEIVLMGGAMREGGNTTPSAEFNIFVDPHAADIVFRCGRPITVMPLDTTHQVITNKKITEKIGKIGNRVGEIVKSMLEFYNRFDKKKYGTDGGPLHDPCTIAYLLEPKIFVGKKVNLTVELQSKLTLGSTAVDFWSVTDRPKNVNWIYGVNSDSFFRLLIDKLSLLP